MPAQPASTTDPAMTSAPTTREVCFIFIAPFLGKAFARTITSWVPPLETLSHPGGEFPGAVGIYRTCNSSRQHAVEQSEQKLGRRTHTIRWPREGFDGAGRRIDLGSQLDQCLLRCGARDLSPARLNSRCESRGEPGYDQPTRQMNRRLQKWKGVTDDRSPERSIVTSELFIAVSGQSLVTSELEQDLWRGRPEESPRISVSEQLKRPDLPPRREPQFESLPAQSSICSFIVDPPPHSAIDEHPADFGIEFQSGDRPEVVAFPNSAVRAESFAGIREQSAKNILLHRSIASWPEFDPDQRSLLQTKRTGEIGGACDAVEVIEIVGASEQ